MKTKGAGAKRADYDSPWKNALDRYFKEFLAFFFPAAHEGIDWGRGCEPWDKELQKAVRDAKSGRRLADKLYRVWRLDGEAQLVYVHVEIQGQAEAGFGKRIYVYHYRIADRYEAPVASFAVLADDKPGWRPEGHEQELWGCELRFRFPVAKLLDYETRWEQLENDANPFAVVVMAHLRALQTAGDCDRRYAAKSVLTKSLYRRGYPKEDVLELYRFIDWVLELPEEREEEFLKEVRAFEEGEHMEYVTSAERIGRQQGWREGRQEGRQEGRALLLARLCRRRFGGLPKWAEERLAGADVAQLEGWAERILDAHSLDEVFGEK